MISMLGKVHAALVFDRRAKVLAQTIDAMIPRDASVIDVGCGDGTIASLIQTSRSDLAIEGIDVMVRPETKVPVSVFDGKTLPFAAKSRDVVMFVDVLHHTLDPLTLIKDAARVARKVVIIKDHVANTSSQRAILSMMDWVGNAPHGVVLPYNYQSEAGWSSLFAASGLKTRDRTEAIPLYPWPASLVFGGRLHFVSALAPSVDVVASI